MSSLDYLDDFVCNNSELFWLEINYSLVIVSTYPKRDACFAMGKRRDPVESRTYSIFDK